MIVLSIFFLFVVLKENPTSTNPHYLFPPDVVVSEKTIQKTENEKIMGLQRADYCGKIDF